MPRRSNSLRSQSREEYQFKIDAYTPTKIPMLRLAEYMRELAQILGEPTQVHFIRLVRGSTTIVHEVELEAIPKVFARVSKVKQGEGPSDSQRAYRSVNKMLREDNAVGLLRKGTVDERAGSEPLNNGHVILAFPGRDEPQEGLSSVRQYGSVDGIVTSVRGKDETAHIILRSEDQQISGFYTNRSMAKQLAARWDEAVRVYGRGRWKRDSEGSWSLIDFKIDSFDPIDDSPLSTALADLRQIQTEWDDSSYEELRVIRHGDNGDGGS